MPDNEITVIYGNDPREMTLSLLESVKAAADISPNAKAGIISDREKRRFHSLGLHKRPGIS